MPKIDEQDPTMIPGNPACNYEKYLAAQPKIWVSLPSDQRNPQYKTRRLTFNGHPLEIPLDKMVEVPKPYAIQVILSGIGTTTDAALMKEFEGQIAQPITGPIPGPISGMYVEGLPS